MENKKNILIVEDEKSLRNALHDKLIKEGFNVFEGKDGKDGLDLALKERPDLILLDVLMPVMDGITMLKVLRGDEWGKNVPVIILTNLSGTDEGLNKDITDLEPTYFFVKNERSLEEIVEKIKERLGLL